MSQDRNNLKSLLKPLQSLCLLLISIYFVEDLTIMLSPEAMQDGHDSFTNPATKLRHFLENSKEILLCPGVYDGFSARIALSVGFSALYMVSLSCTSRVQELSI